MTKEQAGLLIDILKSKAVHFDIGLTDDEVTQVQNKFEFTFPPDLKLLLQTALPVSNAFVNWRLGLASDAETNKIKDKLSWPLEGMLFDIKNNVFWLESWGEKPESYEEQERIAAYHYQTYPKLVPIFAHRYIPANPHENGNPIFSVYQMDIIYYGYNLPTYLANELHFALPTEFDIPKKPVRQIDFWSDWVEGNF